MKPVGQRNPAGASTFSPGWDDTPGPAKIATSARDTAQERMSRGGCSHAVLSLALENVRKNLNNVCVVNI